MSGPKVVHIVTREEQLAECTAALARLDLALRAWTATDAAAKAATQARREALAAALAQADIRQLARDIAAETRFVRAAIDDQRAAAAAAKALALRQARQQRDNAETLLRALTKASRADPALIESLRRVRDAQTTGDAAERAMRAVLQQLAASPAEPAVSEAQRQIAGRIQVAESAAPAAWSAGPGPEEKRLSQIEQQLAQLSCHLGDSAIRAFLDRLYALGGMSPDAHSQPQIDSLVIDIQQALKQAQEAAALSTSAQELLAEIESDAEAGALAAAGILRAALEAGDALRLGQALDLGQAAWRQHLAGKAAAARRAAILGGLASLGYAVHEGMRTALASRGRVVLKSPAAAAFGVEIIAPADAERLQVRAVAFENPADSQRGRDVEMQWCADFQKLKEELATQGDALSVAVARAAGEMPLKVIDAQSVEDEALAARHR